MAFRLAERLGYTVGQLLAVVDSRELSEWIAYDRIKGPSEAWEQTAQLCYVMACLHSKKPGKYADYLPKKKKVERISDGAIRARLAPFRQPSTSPRV